MLSLLIDSFYERDVATVDVVGAYLMSNLDEFIIVKLIGKIAEMMCTVNEKYKAYISYEKGKQVLYLKLNKALYGCMKYALL